MKWWSEIQGSPKDNTSNREVQGFSSPSNYCFIVASRDPSEHMFNSYTDTYAGSHLHSQESNWHLIIQHWTEAVLIIVINPCYYTQHWDARLHPLNVTWLIEMPVRRLLWFELISGVRSFRLLCSTELDAVGKAADQQDWKCINNTHSLNCKWRQTNRDRNTGRQVRGRTGWRMHKYTARMAETLVFMLISCLIMWQRQI